MSELLSIYLYVFDYRGRDRAVSEQYETRFVFPVRSMSGEPTQALQRRITIGTLKRSILNRDLRHLPLERNQPINRYDVPMTVGKLPASFVRNVTEMCIRDRVRCVEGAKR